MDALKVTEYANTKAKDLSGGTKRKVRVYILIFVVYIATKTLYVVIVVPASCHSSLSPFLTSSM